MDNASVVQFLKLTGLVNGYVSGSLASLCDACKVKPGKLHTAKMDVLAIKNCLKSIIKKEN